jgi:hypothetical protein
MEQLTSVVSLLAALSIASERLVEIIKGLIPSLDQKSTDPKTETQRRAKLQSLALFAGIVTAFIARQAFPDAIHVPRGLLSQIFVTVGIGLLASGGSGFWNSILDYVNGAKDLKQKEADKN